MVPDSKSHRNLVQGTSTTYPSNLLSNYQIRQLLKLAILREWEQIGFALRAAERGRFWVRFGVPTKVHNFGLGSKSVTILTKKSAARIRYYSVWYCYSECASRERSSNNRVSCPFGTDDKTLIIASKMLTPFYFPSSTTKLPY